MAKKSTQLVIKHHQPVKYWLMILMYLTIAVGAGWFLYTYAQIQAGLDDSEYTEKIDSLEQRNQVLGEQESKLSEQIAILERDYQVERGAYSKVKDNLKVLQQEVIELKEEVAFYRGIVAAAESARGLNIQSIEVNKTPEDRVYRYKLVLTQVMKNEKKVRGSVKLFLEGVSDGLPKQLSMADLSGGKRVSRMRLNFKYFQTFEGNMVIPEDFSPSQVIVEIATKGKKKVKLRKVFEWAALLI